MDESKVELLDEKISLCSAFCPNGSNEDSEKGQGDLSDIFFPSRYSGNRLDTKLEDGGC